MNIVIPRRNRRSAFPALRDVRNFDRLIDDFWPGFGAAPRAWAGKQLHFAPHIDLSETDDAYEVKAELPGVEEKDFEVTLEEDTLLLSGEKRSEHTDEGEGRRYVESVSGRFERRIALPMEVDADNVKATYKNGVLSIMLPKLPEAKPRTRSIDVTTS
ncbi:MAG: molecular chaperone Hsp20 [Deltaproteobacteria bacterium]|nr:molecular chaperone Hsp20 [Deltaproteobacteria bacterium]